MSDGRTLVETLRMIILRFVTYDLNGANAAKAAEEIKQLIAPHLATCVIENPSKKDWETRFLDRLGMCSIPPLKYIFYLDTICTGKHQVLVDYGLQLEDKIRRWEKAEGDAKAQIETELIKMMNEPK
jgi:hypothetical protein